MRMYEKLHGSENGVKDTKAMLSDDLGGEAMEQDAPPNDIFLHLLPPSVKGYSLKRKSGSTSGPSAREQPD
ncbi:hypothetical protein SAMD00023353_3400190 [Rosellinia necatrix]|uniref:Uncharacterized protein n=1 Tax=Rosellinia necatrix TaxID=77044 RepID=A0A1S8A8R5_ROSNE|nr:hypothetical protein SAMD00023353_3400190 [Rosellinia necatrix]